MTMLSKDQSRILEFELCLSLLQLRKRNDLVRDIIPEKVVPTDLQKILQELLTVIGSKETATSIPETDRNMIRLLFSTTLMQLKVLLCKIECLNLEEMLEMEIDVEHLEEVLDAIIRFLSQNKATSRKRPREETFITTEIRKSDIAEQASVPKRVTEPNEPLTVTDKASISMSKDVKASTSKDNSLQGEENDGKHATGNKKPATVSELADKKPAVYHEFCGKKPASGPELCDNEPGTGPELRDEELAVGTECHDQKRVSGDELSENKSASDPELSDKKPAVGNEVQNKTCDPDPGLWDNKPAASSELTKTGLEASVNEQSYIQDGSCPASHDDIFLSSNDPVMTIEIHKQLQDETGIDKNTCADDTDVDVEETFEGEMDDDDDVKVVNMFPVITGKALNKQDDGLRLAPPSQVMTKSMTNNIHNSIVDKTVPKQNEHDYHPRNHLEIKQAKATRQQKRKLPYQAPKRSDGKKCCRMKCMERTDFDDIQFTVINLSPDAKKELIKKFVTEKPCTRTSVNSRRSRNRTYHIPTGEGPEDEICKVTFMNLLGISSDFIDAVFRANRNKMSNNIITNQEQHEDESAAVNLVNTENSTHIPTTVDESNFHLSDLNSDFNEKSREESRLMLNSHPRYDNQSGFGDLLSFKTMDYQEEGSIIDSNTLWETEQIHKTSTEILPSDTTSDIIANANKAVLPDSIYESSTRPSLSHLEQQNANIVKPVNMRFTNTHTGNIQFKVNSLSQNEKTVPHSQAEFLAPTPQLNMYQKPVVNKLERGNKLENDLDSPSRLPFSVSPVLMASDLIPNDLQASSSVSSSYTSNNMYKRVYPGKPQAVVPPKKRPQPPHTTVGKHMHSVNDSLSNVTAPQQYDQRVLTPEQITEIGKIYQTQVLHLKEGQADYDVNITLQQIKNLHDLREISIWYKFVNNTMLEEIIKQQCNLTKLAIKSGLFDTVESIAYIAQGLADQAGTVEELYLSRCGFIGDQLKNVLHTQRNLTKLNLTCCNINPDEAKALAQGLSYTGGKLQILNLRNNNIGSAAGDVSKALINHHKLCKLNMRGCEMEPAHVKVLCEGLSQMKGSLEELNLSNNYVGTAAGDVSKALINHHKLCKLNMSECEMEPDDVKALCEGLSQMKGSLEELSLSHNNVGPSLSHILFSYTHRKSAAGDVSKALINHHKLCKLDMSRCWMTPDDVKALCEGLSQMKGSLVKLNLGGNNVGSAAGDVSKALINHHNLCKLDMSGCEIEPDDVKALCEGLSQMKGSLVKLNLGYNNVGSAAGDVSKALINQHKLYKLDMSVCGMAPDDVKALCEGLSQMKGSLGELDLSDNNVGSAAGDVSKALINHHKLCKLDLSEYNMKPDDVKALCEGLSQMKGSLEELNFGYNNVGSAAGDVSKALINHHNLCKLDMSGCEIEPDDVKALCEGLSQMKGSLVKLNLGYNNVGSAAGDVSKALINHHKLCKLDMSGCGIEPDDVKALCEGLSQMKGSLEELNLSGNNVRSAAGDVSKALINHHKLCKLDMSGCEMEPDDMNALCEGLSQMKGSLEELNLSNNYVGSVAGDVSKALINHHKMCKLDMIWCKMEPDDVKALCEGLSQMKGSLQELNLNHNNVGSAAWDVSKALINHHKLCKLDMSWCNMEPDDVNALCEGLSQMKGSLVELNLSYNNVGSAAGDVSKALINHHKMCKLDMIWCKMEPDDVKALCEGLSQMKGSLGELNLSHNNVGSAAGDVRKALINHHKLCKLDLSMCWMEPDDVKALCEGLSQMKGSLGELNLSYNNVGSAAGDVSKALINHHKLCKLDMSWCNMEPDDVKALCEGLSQMKGSMQELNLNHNNVGSAAGDVSKALINHHKLCKLDMSWCNMEPDDVNALCAGLSQMKGSLVELNLSYNNVGSAAGDVSKALINHHNLCKLDMSVCRMGPDDVKALCEGLSQMKGSLEELNLMFNNTDNEDDIKQILMKKYTNLKIEW